MLENALSISTEIPVLALVHIPIILQTRNDCQTLCCLMTTYMYTKSTSSIDQNRTTPIGIICYNQIMTHSCVVCRANYVISQKNGYDHEFDE